MDTLLHIFHSSFHYKLFQNIYFARSQGTDMTWKPIKSITGALSWPHMLLYGNVCPMMMGEQGWL